jgi:hypothetical protein
MARADELFGNNLPPRARAVVDAFLDARTSSTSFALACGLLPELSESCTESLHGRGAAARDAARSRPLRRGHR